jgi:hypothetical protein
VRTTGQRLLSLGERSPLRGVEAHGRRRPVRGVPERDLDVHLAGEHGFGVEEEAAQGLDGGRLAGGSHVRVVGGRSQSEVVQGSELLREQLGRDSSVVRRRDEVGVRGATAVQQRAPWHGQRRRIGGYECAERQHLAPPGRRLGLGLRQSREQKGEPHGQRPLRAAK